MDAYPFPSEFVNPKDKEVAEYGNKYAKAMYYTNNRYGFRSLYDNTDYQSLTEFAQGRQSVTNIRKLMGFHADPNSPGFQDGPASLAYIDIQTLNLAPKYINRAVAKMQRLNYDISLESIDLLSLDEKADYAASVQAFYRLKDWVERIGVSPQAAFPGLDIESLPKYADELIYDMTVNPKIKKEIAGELALKLVLWINRFMQKLREVDWDLVVYGRGHLHCFTDLNGVPRIERVNPKYWIGSYIDNDDYEDQEYAGFIECITPTQFIREATGSMDQDSMQKIVQQYGIKNSATNSYLDQRTLAEYDNLTYIPVMRFYFLSEDNRTFVTRKNQFGGDTIMERDCDWVPDEKVAARYNEGGDSTAHKAQYTSVYGGTWIIDSDIVFGYGRKEYPRTNLVNATLPIKTFATNFKEGRSVSFASQMVEPVYMINVAWNKIKETLAKGWIGLREVNFSEIEAVAMGRGGRVWSQREVYEYFEMSNTLITRGVTNPYGQTNGRAVSYQSTGVDLSDYFNTLSVSINLLEQMTGTSIAESADVPDRLPAAAVKQSQFSGDLDMEYLYNAHEYLYQRTAHVVLLMMQETIRNKKKIRGFLPALGKVNTSYHEVSEDVAYCEYGMIFGRQPGPEEWAEFYQDVRIALEGDKISLSDSIFLREIDNLKQARQIMVIREKQHRRNRMEEQSQMSQMQAEATAQQAGAKMEMDLAYMQREGDIKRELLILDGKIKLNNQLAVKQADASIMDNTSYMKKVIEKQKGTDEIIKQGMRNTVEREKVDKRADKSPGD
jgi:hypothetical protein